MESHQKLRNLFNLTFFGTPGFLSESPESWNVVPKLFTPHPNRFEIRPPFSHEEEMQGLKKQERKRGNDEKYRVNYQNKTHTPTALFHPNSNTQKYTWPN